LKRLARYGNDVVVVWDSEDEGTDAYLSAGLMICKALAVRNAVANDEIAADIDLLEKAIREIERQSSFLEEIKTSSSTIKNGADKILNRVETMRAAFVKQIEALDTQASLLRKFVQ
jgi:septal ring factor EnvC (AmiA/AmiB activator)